MYLWNISGFSSPLQQSQVPIIRGCNCNYNNWSEVASLSGFCISVAKTTGVWIICRSWCSIWTLQLRKAFRLLKDKRGDKSLCCQQEGSGTRRQSFVRETWRSEGAFIRLRRTTVMSCLQLILRRLFSNWNYIPSKEMVINKWYNCIGFGSGRGIILGLIPEFSWSDWGEPRKIKFRIASLRLEIWTRDFWNKEQEC